MRAIGRDRRDSSPEITDVKGWAANKPVNRRIVVPLFPASSLPVGFKRPADPFPITLKQSPLCCSGQGSQVSIWDPRPSKQRNIEILSSPSQRLDTCADPFPIVLSINARIDIDLSPGREMD